MEKICEFCTALRPVVYCKSDAAHLCLSCDAKVHSANALSSRHLRSLLCDLCRYHPAYVRCTDHQMFMCRSCDRSLHDGSSQHQKQVISSYMGCPSAKDFAALWGFELNEQGNSTRQDHFVSTSHGSEDSSVVNLAIPRQSCLQIGGPSVLCTVNPATLSSSTESEVGSSSQQSKIYKGQQQHSSHIMQQILDLKRLQLTDGSNLLPMIRGQEQTDISSSIHYSPEFDENLDQHSQLSQDSSLQELKVETLPFTFSQMENLPSSSNVGLPVPGESFWQCKSPVQSSQLWSQNMQDLGVCEELYNEDFNIPDVDLTFRNFEELFGGDQDPIRSLLDDKDISCSSVERDLSHDTSDYVHLRAMETPSPHKTTTIKPYSQKFRVGHGSLID